MVGMSFWQTAAHASLSTQTGHRGLLSHLGGHAHGKPAFTFRIGTSSGRIRKVCSLPCFHIFTIIVKRSLGAQTDEYGDGNQTWGHGRPHETPVQATGTKGVDIIKSVKSSYVQ